MNKEEFPDLGIYYLENYGNKIASYSFAYFIVPGFRRQNKDTFIVMSATVMDDQTYDLTVLFQKELCYKITELIKDKDEANRLKDFFNAPTDELVDFMLGEPITIYVETALGRKTSFGGKGIVPFIATKVSKAMPNQSKIN